MHETTKTGVVQVFGVESRHLFALLSAVAMVGYADRFSQIEFSVVLTAAILYMVWFGRLVLRWSIGEHIFPQLFTSALVGQYIVLISWFVLSPVLFAVGKMLGSGVPLALFGFLLLLGSIRLSPASQASYKVALVPGTLAHAVIALFLLAALYKVSAYYSFRAGALGLDTHQHIYLSNELYHAGYLKISSGSSGWIDQYPKGLHALTALWAMPGFGDHIGPMLKIMPALQAMLAVGAAAELCLTWLLRKNVPSAWMTGFAVILLVVLFYTIFRGTRFVYPIIDLNSTGRLAASASCLLPLFMAAIAILFPSRRQLKLAAASLGIAGAVLAKLNPTLAVAFASMSLPGWLLLMGRASWPLAPESTARLSAWVLAGGILGVMMTATDPFYLAVLSSKAPVFADAMNSIGLRQLPGRISVVPGEGLGDTLRRIFQAMATGLHAGWPGLPDATTVISKRFAWCVNILIWIALFFGLIRAAMPGKRFGRAEMPVLMLMVMYAGSWVNEVLSEAIFVTLGHATLEASIVSTYIKNFNDILLLVVIPVCIVSSLSILLACYNPQVNGAPRPRSLLWVSTLFLALIAVRFLPMGEAPSARSLGWWQPVKESQLDAFQRLENAVPDDGSILVDAAPVQLNGREHWILPMGEGAAYLAIGTKPYLFNVHLGDSYALRYEEINRSFCSGTVESARSFLHRHQVRYVFIVSRNESYDAIRKRSLCGISYADLGITFPAVATEEYGLSIFALNPPGKVAR